MLSAIIIAAIAVAIFLGYKTKLNTGLFCIVFAYIIGCLIMGLKPKQVISFWPVSTMFVILPYPSSIMSPQSTGRWKRCQDSCFIPAENFQVCFPLLYLQ